MFFTDKSRDILSDRQRLGRAQPRPRLYATGAARFQIRTLSVQGLVLYTRLD